MKLVGAITGVVLVAATASAWTLISERSDGSAQRTATNVPASWQRPVVSRKGLEQRLGVQLVHVAVTGDGGLLDLRFRVVDPNTAADLHAQATPPAIVDESTGIVANALLMGHSHHGPFKAGVSYYLIFENPANTIQQGGEVSVLLGDTQVEHVQVQ